MGFYSSVFIPVTCPECHTEVLSEYQFRYGNIYLKEYRLGDQVDLAAEPLRKLVGVYAFCGSCPNCNGAFSKESDEYTLYIEDGRIKSVGPLLEQLHSGPNFVVLKEA